MLQSRVQLFTVKGLFIQNLRMDLELIVPFENLENVVIPSFKVFEKILFHIVLQVTSVRLLNHRFAMRYHEFYV